MGIVDIPLKLIHECVLSNGNVELDQDPHLVVFVRSIW